MPGKCELADNRAYSFGARFKSAFPVAGGPGNLIRRPTSLPEME
jgi:hypothetical protein